MCWSSNTVFHASESSIVVSPSPRHGRFLTQRVKRLPLSDLCLDSALDFEGLSIELGLGENAIYRYERNGVAFTQRASDASAAAPIPTSSGQPICLPRLPIMSHNPMPIKATPVPTTAQNRTMAGS